jgi:PBP1b-binding outer membrane lipoprotein LpoB
MRSGRTGVAAAIVTTALLVAACAGEAGNGAEAQEPTTTERPTTTTTEPTTTTTAPADDDIPSEGDLAACAPVGEVTAAWSGPPTEDVSQVQSAVQSVLNGASQADDTELVAALDRLRTAVNAYDVDAASTAMISYMDRCMALGAPR